MDVNFLTTILYRGLRNDFFFSGHILFSNFYLDFCFPFIILPFIFLFYLDFSFSFLFGIFFEYFEKRLKGIFDQCSGGQSFTLFWTLNLKLTLLDTYASLSESECLGNDTRSSFEICYKANSMTILCK